jgi:AP-3 complex subunit delta-1
VCCVVGQALELLTGMVTKRNLMELVHKLMQHVLLAEGHYRDHIIEKIIFMCSRDKYAYLSGAGPYLTPSARSASLLPSCSSR